MKPTDRSGGARPGLPRPWIVVALLVLVSFLSAPAEAQTGRFGAVRGSVYDAEYDVPLANVRVTLVGANTSTLTGDGGSFLFEEVPAGSYSLSFSKDGYDRLVLPEVVVTPGRMTDLGRAGLEAEVYEMPELIVTGADLLASSEIGQLQIRAEALATQDAISSELISKAGVGDVAGALKMVVGASVVEGKYATVRGLSDRYTGTTLNGVRVPSADPSKRAVQVDLFPTGTIENITVTKTFTPDLQGDFTGGGVDIQTRSIPDGFVLSLSAGAEYDSIATDNPNFLTYEGGGVASTSLGSLMGDLAQFVGTGLASPVIGADPDELREIDLIPTEGRDFPEVAREKPSRTLSQVNRLIAENPTQEGFEATAEYDTLTNAFVPVMGVSTRTPGTNYGFSAVVGNRFELGRNDVIGVIGALTYSHKYDMFLDGVNNLGGVQPGQPAEQPPGVIRLREDHVGNEELQIGGLATLVYQPNPDHEFALKMILNQAAQDQARFQYQPIGVDGVEQNQTLRYIGRTVTSYQLHGRSDFNVLSWGSPETTGLKLDWFGSINYTRQDEPDVRFFRNKVEDGTYRIPDNSVPALNTRRIFRDIEEYGTQFEANLEIPFVQWSGTMGNIRTGVFAERTEREYRQRSFVYETARQVSGSDLQGFLASSCNSFKFQNVPGEVYTNPRQGGDLWTDVFTDDDRTGYVTEAFCDFFLDIPPGPPFFGPYTEPLPTPAPNQLLWVATTFNDDVIYDGDQEFTAAYAMTDLPLTRKLRLIGGARFEKTLLAIDPSDPLDDPDNPNDGQIKIIEFLDPNQNPCDPTVQDNCTRTIAQVPAEQAAANIDETHVLPSIGLVYEVIPNMNLRTSWSQTIARPTLRELAPAATEEFLFGDSFIGNNRLVISEIENLDLRWEWFRRPGEVLAFSLFKKELTNPIELISFQPTGENSYVQPVNFERGRLEGYEVEFRTGLDLIARRLTGLNIGVNYTDLQSEVDVPLFEQRSLAQFELDQEVRSLQGQPDSVFNINLTYDNARSGTSFGIFYNRVTDTLLTGAAVSEDGKPNVYELTFRPLDVTFSQRVVRFGKSTLSFSAKARNLMQGNLETVYRKPSGAQLTKTERVTAARYSLSAKLSW